MNKSQKKFGLLGGAIGWGAQIVETEQGPAFLLEGSHLQKLLTELKEIKNFDCTVGEIIYPLTAASKHRDARDCVKDYGENLAEIIEFTKNLANKIAKIIKQNRFPITLGGDHSLAIGTWSGITDALDAAQQFGLIWIDAHMDSHTPQTTPSHAIHGMPLAVLLGYGEKALVNLIKPVPKLSPNHVVLYGVRSFERGEAELLASLNIRIYHMEEIRDRGVGVTFREAIERAALAPKGFGVSLDLDAFDPREAPGVGSKAPNGLFAESFLLELKKAFLHPKIQALEITEFNPVLDHNKLTEQLIFKILEIILN